MYQVGNLTEMMLAAFLSLLVMASCVKSYVMLQHIAQLQQQMQIEQQTALVVINLINAEIEKAGHRGCYPVDMEAVQINTFFSVRYQDFPGVELQSDSRADNLVVDKSKNYHKGQHLMISDCQHAEILQVAKVIKMREQQVIIPVHPLQYSYRQHAEIANYIKHHYYLTSQHEWVRADDEGDAQVIVKGVSNLQFRDDGKGVHYEFATNNNKKVTTWYGYAAKNTG